MRPDDRRAAMAGSANGDAPRSDVPLETALAALDDELAAAGAQARRALQGSTQPTRVFTNRLREHLLGQIGAPAISSAAGAGAALPRESPRGSRLRTEPVAGEGWLPTPLHPQVARRTPTILPRARWSLLAAAALTTVIVAGALGARFDWLLPAPTSDASRPPATTPPETRTPEPTSPLVVVPVDSAPPVTSATEAPVSTPTPRAEPTPTRKPEPTTKPEPTLPPVGSMELLAKACPGGVILDWTKPSSAVGHYHVLRGFGDSVPATYPAEGAAEIESATSWSAGVTDGYDAGLDGGATAAYRAFAFGGEDHLLAFSPSRTVIAAPARELGTLAVEALGPGSVRLSWGASEVPAACFTYGKLVAAADDPDPSYVKGSPYLAAIGDQATTSITLDGLSSGQTVWLRYELIRVTGTGKFVVGRTDVLQVTYP